jgi:hypothetical protein
MTPEQRAFVQAQPAYDAALHSANALGAPPATLNALLSPDVVEIGTPAQPREIALFPLTLGGYLLIQVAAPAWLDGGSVTMLDQAVMLLALTNPEWVRGNLHFEELAPSLNKEALSKKLEELIHDTPVWVWPPALEHFQRQLQTLAGERREPEDADPLVVTPGTMASPPAATETPATPAG